MYAAGLVCVVAGTLSAMLFVGMLWVLGAAKFQWLYSPWLTATWLAGVGAALALLAYGVTRLLDGASLQSGLFYVAFLALFTVTVACAARLLVLRHTMRAHDVALHYVLLSVLFVYATLVALWLPGTLMSALTPLLAVLVQAGLVLQTRARLPRAPDARASPRRDAVFLLALLLTALGPLVDWLLCLVGSGRDWLWGFLVLAHALNTTVYLKALPRPPRAAAL